MKDETPQSNWAAWALLQAAEKPGALEEGSIGRLCAQRLGQFVGDNPDSTLYKIGKRSFLISTGCGHWGRSNSIEAAAASAHKAGASKTSKAFVTLVLNDDTPEISRGGMMITESDSASFNIGCVGTIGGILNANKK